MIQRTPDLAGQEGRIAEIRIGTSGWLYAPWRAAFYPPGLPHRRELEYISRRMNSVEINGSFYSLQRPESYRRWFEQTPGDFLFAVKGGRFITHMKQLNDIETPLANFFASGVLALGHKLGPILWQLPPRMRFDAGKLAAFFALLPRSTAQAARLAQRHDGRLGDRVVTSTDADRRLCHALEVRHPSFCTPAFVHLLRDSDIALVVADTAGTWPHLEDVTADFVYVRLHGDQELYTSGYTEEALRGWAAKIRIWTAGEAVTTEHTVAEPAAHCPGGRDVYAYFDNDVKAHAPHDAITLAGLLAGGGPGSGVDQQPAQRAVEPFGTP